MKRFLWFNLKKIKTDADYFLVVFILLIIIQLSVYFPLGKSFDFLDLIYGGVDTIFFLYISFCKKDFSYKDVWNCFWNDL